MSAPSICLWSRVDRYTSAPFSVHDELYLTAALRQKDNTFWIVRGSEEDVASRTLAILI